METVVAFRPDAEFHTDERCYITELHNTPADTDCSVARARVEPGVTTKLHCLRNTVERYVIIEGEGMVEVGDSAPRAVGPMDMVNIPAGTSQRITNTGTCDLVFLCICTPRFACDDYQELEGPSAQN